MHAPRKRDFAYFFLYERRYDVFPGTKNNMCNEVKFWMWKLLALFPYPLTSDRSQIPIVLQPREKVLKNFQVYPVTTDHPNIYMHADRWTAVIIQQLHGRLFILTFPE